MEPTGLPGYFPRRSGTRRNALAQHVANDVEIAFWVTQDAQYICTDRPDLALAARRAAQSKTSPAA